MVIIETTNIVSLYVWVLKECSDPSPALDIHGPASDPSVDCISFEE